MPADPVAPRHGARAALVTAGLTECNVHNRVSERLKSTFGLEITTNLISGKVAKTGEDDNAGSLERRLTIKATKIPWKQQRSCAPLSKIALVRILGPA